MRYLLFDHSFSFFFLTCLVFNWSINIIHEPQKKITQQKFKICLENFDSCWWFFANVLIMSILLTLFKKAFWGLVFRNYFDFNIGLFCLLFSCLWFSTATLIYFTMSKDETCWAIQAELIKGTVFSNFATRTRCWARWADFASHHSRLTVSSDFFL